MDLMNKPHAGWHPNIEEVELSDGTKSFFASHPYLPGIEAHGETLDAAADNWRGAIIVFLEHLELNHLPRPPYTYFCTSVIISDAPIGAVSAKDVDPAELEAVNKLKLSMGEPVAI